MLTVQSIQGDKVSDKVSDLLLDRQKVRTSKTLKCLRCKDSSGFNGR
jgi:hypothetical protein